jgi:hypothetical protein
MDYANLFKEGGTENPNEWLRAKAQLCKSPLLCEALLWGCKRCSLQGEWERALTRYVLAAAVVVHADADINFDDAPVRSLRSWQQAGWQVAR